jgi:hypothetical protein
MIHDDGEYSWTHSMCDACWDDRHPEKSPTRVTASEPDICCFCSKEHRSGIYVRQEPYGLECFKRLS